MPNEVQKRDQWDFDSDCNSILEDKTALKKQYIRYMLSRTQTMFEWEGLPETIPAKQLELILQRGGHAIFIECPSDIVNGFPLLEGVYATRSALGAGLDEYYRPRKAIIDNPYLGTKISGRQFSIGKDCEIMNNDATRQGLLPMFNKYAGLLAENDMSIRFATINARIPAIAYADNDQTKKDLETYFSDVFEGKKIGVVGGDAFFEGLKTAVYSASNVTVLKDLIEEQQYIKSSWFLELGLQANYNMKREAINGNEAGMNEDALTPLIDDMLHEREEGCKRINAMFGLNVSVKLSSAWKRVQEDLTQHGHKTPTDEDPEEGDNPDEDKGN